MDKIQRNTNTFEYFETEQEKSQRKLKAEYRSLKAQQNPNAITLQDINSRLELLEKILGLCE